MKQYYKDLIITPTVNGELPFLPFNEKIKNGGIYKIQNLFLNKNKEYEKRDGFKKSELDKTLLNFLQDKKILNIEKINDDFCVFYYEKRELLFQKDLKTDFIFDQEKKVLKISLDLSFNEATKILQQLKNFQCLILKNKSDYEKEILINNLLLTIDSNKNFLSFSLDEEIKEIEKIFTVRQKIFFYNFEEKVFFDCPFEWEKIEDLNFFEYTKDNKIFITSTQKKNRYPNYYYDLRGKKFDVLLEEENIKVKSFQYDQNTNVMKIILEPNQNPFLLNKIKNPLSKITFVFENQETEYKGQIKLINPNTYEYISTDPLFFVDKKIVYIKIKFPIYFVGYNFYKNKLIGITNPLDKQELFICNYKEDKIAFFPPFPPDNINLTFFPPLCTNDMDYFVTSYLEKDILFLFYSNNIKIWKFKKENNIQNGFLIQSLQTGLQNKNCLIKKDNIFYYFDGEQIKILFEKDFENNYISKIFLLLNQEKKDKDSYEYFLNNKKTIFFKKDINTFYFFSSDSKNFYNIQQIEDSFFCSEFFFRKPFEFFFEYNKNFASFCNNFFFIQKQNYKKDGDFKIQTQIISGFDSKSFLRIRRFYPVFQTEDQEIKINLLFYNRTENKKQKKEYNLLFKQQKNILKDDFVFEKDIIFSYIPLRENVKTFFFVLNIENEKKIVLEKIIFKHI